MISRPLLVVVDDDPATMGLYEYSIAKPLNLDFLGFTNPVEALFILRDQIPQPDLLIIDVVMPGLDGAALLRLLRQTGLTTPAILTSALDQDELRIRYSDIAQVITEKTFSASGLQASCSTLLASKIEEAAWKSVSSA